ncbi:SDR family oxidoreductase [Sphingomonas sp. RP10(2022)]|uniref:SDR family oxidoreductase n=1 Tax=Sphingomonas liriopis TaxID=2949094 RepID=A0A9X2HU11_9SPHN|nr:SDR family oxidoreductase [Sphingomonas liriopis]MCP3735877.1 SDR family oxidoreductase [Sphingomonas liriopis]
MKRFVVTGSGSGIGRATAARLRDAGHAVLGVDRANADVAADLGTPTGRAQAIDAIARHWPDGIDGVLAAAGISAPDRAAETIAINHFGAVAVLEGVRPLLAKHGRGRAVAIGSTSVLLPSDAATVALCLAGDEAGAIAAAAASAQTSYMTSKLALTLWLRREAVTRDWAGSGILLNGVAPGVVSTPMTAPLFDDPAMMALIAQSNPMAVEGFAQPEEIAELIVHLLTMEGHYLLGQMIFIDGGTDAIMRPERF